MIAPTSVSSRFNARPVTPLPKSSISLSIASVRPSILATPSPISRTTPTFCFAVAAFAPVIWASISCSRLLINFSLGRAACCQPKNWDGDTPSLPCSKTLRQRVQTRLNAAVINVAADLDAQAADQRRIPVERNVHTVAINFFDPVCHVRLQIGGQGRRAFDVRSATLQIQFHQPEQARQNFDVTARLLCQHERDRLPDAVLIQQTIDLATAEQLPRVALCPFGYFHFPIFGRDALPRVPVPQCGISPTDYFNADNCFSVSSASRR